MNEIDELRSHYDTVDMTESIERARPDDRTISPQEVMVSTSIRLPRSVMQRVRERAAEAGVPTTTLMRQWLVDRLEVGEDEAVVSVADLQRLIAERSHPAT
jgi:predicted DNA binding CopG/RHH family protein